MEEWKGISGYIGLYQVSSNGEVFSMSINRNMSIQTDLNGYLYIRLYNKLKSKSFKIHRLVAFHFIQNEQNLPWVNHIDGNKSNNCVNNLEWCTQSENEKHAHRIGLKNHKGENHPCSKFSDNLIREIRRLFDDEKLSQREIGRRTKMDFRTIHKIVHRQRWGHI
jgi:hypothetical protein